jgi:N-acetylmuramic acid 6-phosphate etherase
MSASAAPAIIKITSSRGADKNQSEPNSTMKERRLRVTERTNPASVGLEEKPALQVLRAINQEDSRVVPAIKKVIPQIAKTVDLAVRALALGGRLIYLGAGTSGRLGVLDAVECWPTFGTDRVQAVLAGGSKAMFRAVEGSEDDPQLAVRDLRRVKLARRDVLVGISASGRTPYTLGGMRYARRIGAATVALTCHPRAPMRALAKVSIVPFVGPEIIAGSSRMKAGTAQKLVLNMISTATMVRLGRTYSGAMIGVQMTNRKLRERGQRILMSVAGVPASQAAKALEKSGRNLPVALLMLKRNLSEQQALRSLKAEMDVSSLLWTNS